MGVAVGDVDTLMPHTLRDGQGGKAHIDQQTDVAMPLRYNYDKPEKPRRIKAFGLQGSISSD